MRAIEERIGKAERQLRELQPDALRKDLTECAEKKEKLTSEKGRCHGILSSIKVRT